MSEAKISYFSLSGLQGKDAKLDWIAGTRFKEIEFDNILPDGKGNWINQTDNDFDSFLALVDKEVKAGRSEKAVFKIFSRGLETGRDEWVYGFSVSDLSKKIKFLINNYISCLNKSTFDNLIIKWDRELRRYLSSNVNKVFNSKQIVFAMYRPFVKKNIYFDRHFNRMPGLLFQIFPIDSLKLNLGITVSDTRFRAFFSVLAINKLPDLHLCATEDAFQCLPLYRYDENGDRIDNITDWGLTQFQNHYSDPKITKENIFHYTYAVLHHPAYRTKYELNLKREFPRLPFYENFHQWAAWGKSLMDLHLNYETIKPYGLKQIEIDNKANPKAKLKADKINGVIILDDNTQLIGVEAIAWDYKLGNRSALEWILDQYKEKKPKDPTIREKFNTYRFADYKAQVIDLLQRVCTVSIQTMAIIKDMPDTVEPQD